MTSKVLMSLVGKYVTKERRLPYFHVTEVLCIKDRQAIVIACYKDYYDALYKCYLEADWETDQYGVHTITNINTLKEELISGSDAQDEQTVSSDS